MYALFEVHCNKMVKFKTRETPRPYFEHLRQDLNDFGLEGRKEKQNFVTDHSMAFIISRSENSVTLTEILLY